MEIKNSGGGKGNWANILCPSHTCMCYCRPVV